MHIDIPDELNHRLHRLAKGTGQDISALVAEAIETRLVMEEQLAQNLAGWTQEELRAAIHEGLESGPGQPFDAQLVTAIKARGREILAARQRDPS